MTFNMKCIRLGLLCSTSTPHLLLVGGDVTYLSSTNFGEFVVMQSLREVVSFLKNERADKASLLGIVTGIRTRLEKCAAGLANQDSLSLCLFSMGKPGSLTESQKLTQRHFWLSAEIDDIKTGSPRSIRNEVNLGYADILLVVWNGATTDDEVVPLLLNASLAMKPVICIDMSGMVRVPQRERLTKVQRHILQCQSPPIKTWFPVFHSPWRCNSQRFYCRQLRILHPN